ncbi:J domain-containing protein [Rhodocytophaga rosea]|uniref:J domain-containing protein n=1 Tax=Rhodocytophaga rosea TaxID=2704465 RepID=A0A6C0GEA0_9BACT|nr:DnaJ domain-containing protein [Rhodocytophaga rosea]QHT66103.1 J domain-containing protein [Rhodocytophaga rosea]
MTDYYQILGISRQAGIQEIKSAFKKLALQYHPDRNAGSLVAEEKFKQINEAYQVLSDTQDKLIYDLKLNGYSSYSYTTDTTQQPTYNQTYTYSRPYSPPTYRHDPNAARKAYGVGTIIILIMAIIGYSLYTFMNQRSARMRYAEALYYIDRNQTYNAFTKLEEAIEFDDEYAEAYLKRGQLWLQLDANSIHAYEDFDKAIRHSKVPVPEMYLFRAMSLLKMRRYERVLTDCAQAIHEPTLKGPAIFLQAAAKKALQDKRGACHDWQQAYELGLTSSADSLLRYCR